MATLTIRGLPDEVMERLRVRAAQHGRLMQEEARVILKRAVIGITGSKLLSLAHENFGPDHGIDIAIPPRGAERPPPDFSE